MKRHWSSCRPAGPKGSSHFAGSWRRPMRPASTISIGPQPTGIVGHLRRNPPQRSASGPTICPGPLTANRLHRRLCGEGPASVLPILMSFPHQASLVLKVRDEGRTAAIGVLQQAMLALLASVPAGKIRFTIIDPTGLGQNFSAFMHLADYDERLVGHRIWTEAAHINQRLADLTEHMENVIQKYLRNQFESIQQYNETAGEVAEPFRVLVVANFPSTSLKRQHADADQYCQQRSALRGLYADEYRVLPACPPCSGPIWKQTRNVLAWEDGRFRWQSDRLAPLELQLHPLPKTN